MSIHLASLHSRFCSREDFHQSLEFAGVMEGIGWSSLPIHGSRISIRQLGPISIGKMQRAVTIDFRRIKSLRKKLCMLRTIIEPAISGRIIDLHGKSIEYSFQTQEDSQRSIKLFAENGFGISTEHYAHSKTAIIDLRDPFPEVLAHMPAKVRTNGKRADRIINSYRWTRFDAVSKTEQSDFFSLHDAWAKEKNIFGFSNHFLETVMLKFATSGWLVQAYTDDVLSGGMMVLIHDRVASYFYTCSSRLGRSTHIPTGMALHAMEYSQREGADIFDFCSVYDERYPKDHPRWKGFTEFKSRFAPIPVYYPPTFSRWF